MSPIPKNWHGKVCIFSKNHKDLKNKKKSEHLQIPSYYYKEQLPLRKFEI